MRKLLITTATVMTLFGALTGTTSLWPAHAQPAPDDEAATPPPAPMHGDWEHHMPPGAGPQHHRRIGELLAPVEDRKLTGPEVQKIAEAYLLWNGNRSWKVTNVAEGPDNTISFAYSTPGGDVIARFKIDRKTGHIDRIS